MGTWLGKKIQDTFKGMLKVGDSNLGVTATLQSVEDAKGTPSAMELSTIRIKAIAGAKFEGDGSLLTSIDTAVLTDITNNNVSITKHGYVPKAPNDAAKFLNGLGVYSIPSGGGDVVGPASATDNRIATFDNTTGKLIQDSGVQIGVVKDNDEARHYNAKVDFGATGGGVANDTTALQNALNASSAVKPLFIPAGTYMVDPLYISSNTVFFGAGMGLTIIKLISGQTWGTALQHSAVLTNEIILPADFGGSGARDEHIYIYDMTLDGNKAGQSGTNAEAECLSFYGAQDCYIDRIEMINAYADGYDLDYCDRVGAGYIKVDGATKTGVHFSTGSPQGVIEGNDNCWIDVAYITNCGGSGLTDTYYGGTGLGLGDGKGYYNHFGSIFVDTCNNESQFKAVTLGGISSKLDYLVLLNVTGDGLEINNQTVHTSSDFNTVGKATFDNISGDDWLVDGGTAYFWENDISNTEFLIYNDNVAERWYKIGELDNSLITATAGAKLSVMVYGNTQGLETRNGISTGQFNLGDDTGEHGGFFWNSGITDNLVNFEYVVTGPEKMDCYIRVPTFFRGTFVIIAGYGFTINSTLTTSVSDPSGTDLTESFPIWSDVQLNDLTASTALALDASKNIISVTPVSDQTITIIGSSNTHALTFTKGILTNYVMT